MVDISKLVKESFRTLSPYFHGGNVWELSEKYNIPLDQLIDFSISTNPLGVPEKALQNIRQSLNLISHYPDPDHEWLLEALSNSADVEPDNVIVGNGSTELIYLFTEVFIESGYEVIIPVPTFSEYKAATERFGGNMTFINCDPAKNFQLNFEELKRAISKKTRIIFLCNPNSPTGCLHEKDDILRFIGFAAEKNVLVFLDEDYIDFVDDSKRYSMAEYVGDYDNLFVLRSLTKFFGLAGARIGFGIASPTLVEILRRAKMPWSVNSLAMFGAVEAVKDEDFIKKSRLLLQRSKREMLEMFRAIPWLKVYPSETNFLLVEIIQGELTSTQLQKGLAKRGFLIRDCKDFDGLHHRFFRVTVRRPEENIKLIETIKSFSNQK
ncbi:MAG: threonine-phosphate decarboxylase [Candidatus Bathyarchaeum sp.]|nr:MAG: threonine-phosphate decarboxylase [Candidatus Bathyarchaeum sp.]